MKKFPVLGSAIALAVAGAFVAVPASAFTHHPSTAKERAATRDLNRQALAQAQGQAPANQQAMNGQAATDQSQPAPAGQPNQQAPNAPQTTTNANGQPAPQAQQPASQPASQ